MMALLLNANDSVSRSYSITKPSPLHPIMPEGVGERTENLLPFDDKNFVVTNKDSNLTVKCENGNLYMQGNVGELISSNTKWKNNFTFELKAGTYYCNSPLPLGSGFGRYIKKYDDDSNILQGHEYTFTITEKTKCYLAFYIYNKVVDSKIELMLNTGSTALPYEPYGYKLPLTVNGVEYPIYLGEVQTTRRIKKYECTGKENWQLYNDSVGAYGTWQFYANYLTDDAARTSAFSNIAEYGVTAETRNRYPYGAYLVTSGTGIGFQMAGAKDVYTNVSAWKSYLAAQYANGTPVTVWYALAEPKTAVVNEPLMKIGDYADTVSMEQAGVSIPTAAGETTISWAGEGLAPSEVELVYKVKR